MDQQDPVEAVWALHDEVRAQAAPFQGAEVLEPVEGADHADCVTVRLDAAGCVDDLRVAHIWRDHVEPDALGSVIVEAIGAAAHKRLGAWAEAVADPERAESPVALTQPPLSDSVTGRLAEIAAAAPELSVDAMEQVVETLHELNTSLADLRGQMAASFDAQHAASSVEGHVTATVTGGGDVLTIDFESAWLKRAHPANIGREALAAIRAAGARAARFGIQAFADDSPIGRLAAIADDPEAIADHFGLRG